MASNKRQFSRCPLDSSPPGAVLTIGRRQIPCQMAQLSIGGSAVIVPEPIEHTGDGLACLKVDGVESVVRITHQELRQNGCLIGLKVVEEVPAQPSHPWVALAWIGALGTVAAAAGYVVLQMQPPIL